MGEGYSREAFDQNEQKIDEARPLAGQKTFGFRADPADIMIAKMEYLGGKQERERLTGLAYEEAVAEDKQRSQESPSSFRIADFNRVLLKTESGNSYIIQRNPSGQGYLVANMNQGTIEQISGDQISNSVVAKGAQVLFGNGAATSSVASAQAWK